MYVPNSNEYVEPLNQTLVDSTYEPLAVSLTNKSYAIASEKTEEKLTPNKAIDPPFSESCKPNINIKPKEISGKTGINQE